MSEFRLWFIENVCSVFGWIALITAVVNHTDNVTSAIYGVGTILMWGIQELLDEMRYPTYHPSQEEKNV